MSERELLAERERYFDEARRGVRELEARWRREPPTWNRPTGDADVDALVWFRYAHTDILADLTPPSR
mgnify:FL=1